MANVNIYVAGVVAGAVANRRRAPNLLRVACVNEEGEHISTRLTARQSHELALQYMQWRRQKEGVAVKSSTSIRDLHVFLRYLARGGYYHQVGRAEGISESATMLYLLRTASFFQHIAAR